MRVITFGEIMLRLSPPEITVFYRLKASVPPSAAARLTLQSRLRSLGLTPLSFQKFPSTK